MKYFSYFSDPDLTLILECFEVTKQKCFKKITELDKACNNETLIQEQSNKLHRINELMDAAEAEAFNRKQQ